MLRILGNVAHKGSEYCIQLVKAGLLPALCATLKMADQEMVTLSLEVLLMMLSSSPQVQPVTHSRLTIYKYVYHTTKFLNH